MLLLALLAFSPALPAQKLLDSLALDTMRGYSDLEEALKDPENVIKLSLRKQKLKVFPREIFRFKNLQYLDLSKNDIKDIPDSIGLLKDLQYLLLSRNEIEYLPREIGELTNLRLLNVNQNELVELPPQIGRLKKLEYLDLWSNNLERFPDDLGELKGNLKVMDLRVILLSDELQQRLQRMLPQTKIWFSPNCKCKY